MKLALKNIKIAKHLSEETTAFTASLYVDGKRVGDVRNGGTGGCNMYSLRPFSLEGELDDLAQAKNGDRWLGLDHEVNSLLDLHDYRKAAKQNATKGYTYTVIARQGKDQFGWEKEYIIGYRDEAAFNAAVDSGELDKYDEIAAVDEMDSFVTL